MLNPILYSTTTGQPLCTTSSRASALKPGLSLTCYLSCLCKSLPWLTTIFLKQFIEKKWTQSFFASNYHAADMPCGHWIALSILPDLSRTSTVIWAHCFLVNCQATDLSEEDLNRGELAKSEECNKEDIEDSSKLRNRGTHYTLRCSIKFPQRYL